MYRGGGASVEWTYVMQAERCPPEDVFVRFLAGHLPDSEVVLLERHTSSCQPCMDLLTTAASLSPEERPGPGAEGPPPVPELAAGFLPEAALVDEGMQPDLPDPRQLGPYRVLTSLGRGAMGVVYRAMDQRSGAEVAVKTLRLPAPDALLSLRREVHTLRQIRHPGVVRILEQGGTESDPPWYAMELVEGETLASRFRRSIGSQPGSQAELLTIVRRLCSTLSVLHASGVIHRDLSPSNVMVRPDGTPVLVDFGFALASGANPAARERLQREAAPAGTLLYMAPEQILGEPSDARADLYSLGCILYEALTGRPPFLGKSAAAIIAGHLRNGVSPPSSLMPGLDARFDELTLRLITRQPRDRMAYADEVGQALDRIGAVEQQQAANVATGGGYLYRPSLVGRAGAMTTLDGLLRRCQNGQGGLALVTGGSGAGKTRLALELAGQARRQGFKVVLGTCTGVALEPLKPLLRAVAERCRRAGRAETLRLLGPHGRLLAEHERSLEEAPGFKELPVVPELPGDAARIRLLDVLEEMLGVFARGRPTLIILDDLHWADELTMAWLHRLSGRFFESNGVLAVGTGREEEMSPQQRERLLQSGATTVHLARLDDRSVEAMIAEMLGSEAPPAGIGPLVTGQAGGNPFFVVEYLRTALAEGRLVRSDGCWRLSAAEAADSARLPTPASVRELVFRRLGRLSGPAQDLVEVAAVLGREMDGEQLLATARAFAGGRDAAGADADHEVGALAELVSRQVLEPAEPGCYRFVHDTLREIALGRIAPEREQSLHGAAAAVLEERQDGSADAGRTYAALAAHYGAAGQHVKCLHYQERAAERALRAGTAHEARRLVSRAIDLVASQKVDATSVIKARLYRLRAEAAFALADLAACRQDAQAALREIHRPLPTTGKGWSLRLAAEASRQILHRALPGVGWRASGAEQLACAEGAAAAPLVASSFYFTGDWVPMTAVVALGTNLAEQAGASALSIESFAQLGYIAGLMGMDAVARFYFGRAAQMAEATGDSRALAVGLYFHAFHDLGRGRWADVEARGGNAIALLDEIGDPQAADVARTIVGHAIFFQGRIEEAGAWYRSLANSARRRANRQHLGWGLALEARSLLETGRAAEAVPLLEEARATLAGLADALSIAMCEGLLASAYLGDGRLDGARALTGTFAPRLAGAVLPLAPCLHAYLAAAEVALACCVRAPADRAARDAARTAARDLRRFARMFPFARPASLRIRAEVAAQAGSRRKTAALARRGLHQAKALGIIAEQRRAQQIVERLLRHV
jgi:tetratricopeptide (TPR) repeat protein